MSIVSRFLIRFVANLIGLLLAAYFVRGFSVSHDPQNIAVLAGVLSLIHMFVRPVLKLIFSPLILITLGFFTIVINAVLLYALDFYFDTISIKGFYSLIYATLIISLIGLVIGSSAKSSK